jgi:non-specific serine/threonine protein kinase
MDTQPSLHNLPAALISFIGREREIGEVRQLLSANRLVTLTGAGGSGKTRLALQVSQALLGDFAHGIWLVELASLSDPAFVAQAVATALDIQEASARPILEVLVDRLCARQVLLVMDNCEHLVSACAELVGLLLERCPQLKILATSREVLGLIGEATWSVPPLSLPGKQPWVNPASPAEALLHYQQSESVQLFVARACAKSQQFELDAENGAWVAEICRRLDGMPLAIELAAARVPSLAVQQIAQRLDDRFRLLTGGSRTAPPRQQTLASTLDWSYALLSASEQKVLQRFSVFAGGATLEAAAAVCETDNILDTLAQLIDKSLVEHSGQRYHLLETVRQYALEKLAQSAEADETRDRHLDYFIGWAEDAEPQLYRAEQMEWLELYEVEHDNLRLALEWCLSAQGRLKAQAGLQLAAACGRFWLLHSYFSEGRKRLSTVLEKEGAQECTLARAYALFHLAEMMYLQADYPPMHAVAEEALSIFRELGDPGRVGTANTLDSLGELASEEGDYDRALAYFQEALEIYRGLNDLRGITLMHMQIGWTAMRAGGYAVTEGHLNEFLRLAQQVSDKTFLAFAYSGMGEVTLRQGQIERAISLLMRALTLFRERGDKWGTATQLGSLGWAALRQHDFEKMKSYLQESLSIRKEINDRGGIAWCLEKLAEAKVEQRQLQDAVRIFGHAESLRAPIGSVIELADQPDHERILLGLQAALGKQTFDSLWQEGSAMPLEQVIDLALSETPAVSPHTEKERFGGLTAREREVAAWIARGKSNREIAAAMTVGVKTVETYVTRILGKLGFTSRVQIATWAIEVNLNK